MTGLNRRGLLKIGGAAVAAPYLWIPAQAEPGAWRTQTVAPFVEVKTASGRIRGGHSRGALAFKGIPYAGSVTGKNRFKAAPKVKPWTGVLDATRLAAPSLQTPKTTYGEHEPAYDEQCLFLNVWTPAVKDGGKRPVMVYCHGGAFETGSGGQDIQDGAHLAAAYDVVVVAMNHRLGLLGFLYLGELGGEEYATSGNQSILDIVAALKWVKENIATFGGDPGNVMLFGESGGGFKTCTLMAMPGAQGLFHKVGVQSGSFLEATPKETATETARRVLAAFDIAPHDLHKLADVPAEKLLALQIAGSKGALGKASKEWLATHPNPPSMRERNSIKTPGGWDPVVDGTYLPRNPFSPDATPLAANIPAIIGATHDEPLLSMRDDPSILKMDEPALTALGRSFLGDQFDTIISFYKQQYPKSSISEVAVAMMGVLNLGGGAITLADRKAQQPAPVYRYRYDYSSNVPIKGTDWTLRACHAGDIAMVFLNYDIPGLQGDGPGVAEASKAMSSYFASFARSGVPTAKDQPVWPRYDTTTRPTMLINTACRVENDPNSAERKFMHDQGFI
jgi:para-nitrobenzyl esterase